MLEGRTFGLERLSEIWAEVKPLAAANQAEVDGARRLSFDHGTYTQAEAAGTHLLHTARINGALVGYCSTWLTRCAHDGQLDAHEDAIYVLPEHRGYLGRDLEHWVDTMLALRGVARSYRERPVHGHGDERAMRRGPFGYQPFSVLFKRDLPRPVA